MNSIALLGIVAGFVVLLLILATLFLAYLLGDDE